MGKFEIINCANNYLCYNQIELNIADFNEHDHYYKSHNLNTCGYWGNYEMFYEHLKFINTSVNNKYITIKDPVTNKNISTDLYFIVVSERNVIGYNSFICYYFKNENIILASPTGSGLLTMDVHKFSLINFNISKIFSIYNYGCAIDDFAYDKILKAKKHLDDMNVNEFNKLLIETPVEIKTFYGFCNNMGHQIFNDYTGLYLLQKKKIFANTDKFIIGPHDCLNFKEYFNYNFPTKQCISDDITTYDNYIGRGVVYKYNYYFVSYKISEFIKSSVFYNNLLTITPSITETANNLRRHSGLKLLIIIREGSRNLINQPEQFVKLIDLLKNNYKNAKIILGGFISDTKSKDTALVGYFNQSYTDIRDLYMKTSNYIINNSIHKNDIININGLTFNETLLITNECNFALYTHGSGATIGAWVCRTPGITLGFHDMNRYKNMDQKICEKSKDLLVYLTDPDIITFDIKHDHEYTYKMNMDKFAEYLKANIDIKLDHLQEV
jgi:hypothetical protein